MRIVCLVTVRAILLSIAIAESDRPFGSLDQHTYPHHQRLPRPIILEPVAKMKSESGPLDWLVKMVSRVIEPPKKPPPAIIGPINLPGMAGQVYIRQLEGYSPGGSNHVVIKVVSRDPLTGMNVPYDSGLSYHPGDFARRTPKSQSYQTISSPGRSPVPFQQGYQSSVNQNSNGQSHYSVNNHHYLNPSAKPLRPAVSNDFYRNHQRNHPDYHDTGSAPTNGYQNSNYHQFQPIATTFQPNYGISPVTSPSSPYHAISHHLPNEASYSNDYNVHPYQNSTMAPPSNNFYFPKSNMNQPSLMTYSDYSLNTKQEDSGRKVNASQIGYNPSPNSVSSASAKYGQVVRNDRMVPSYHNHEFTSRDRTNFLAPTYTQEPQGFRRVPMVKFDLDDVGGLEIVTPPNLNYARNKDASFAKSKNNDGMSKNGGTNEALVDMEGIKKIMHTKNDGRVSDKQNGSQTSKVLQSRLSTYVVIDRSQRRQGSRNVSLESPRMDFNPLDRMDEKKNVSLNEEIESIDEKEQYEAQTINATYPTGKVANLTASNRWRFQEGRQPSRVVKAIYRRKPISELLKTNEQLTDSDSEGEDNYDTFVENSSAE